MTDAVEDAFDGAAIEFFVVDDEDETAKAVEDNGGAYFTRLPDGIPGLQAEVKYKDPNGVVFDISTHGWSTSAKK